jgi:ribosomal-protein-alanine N-acetyltransferase
VARAILRRVIDDNARTGARRAFLEVRASNDAARRLYETVGFTVAHVRRNYYTHPMEDALVLQREDLLRP